MGHPSGAQKRGPMCTSVPEVFSLLQAFFRQTIVPAPDTATRRYLQDETQMFASMPGVVFGAVVTAVLKKNNIKIIISIASLKPNKTAMFGWKIGAIIGTSFAEYSYKNSFLA